MVSNKKVHVFVWIIIFSCIVTGCAHPVQVRQAASTPTSSIIQSIGIKLPVPLNSRTFPPVTPTPEVPQIQAGDWPTYLLNNGGYNPAETVINRTTASQLQLFWKYHALGGITAQPIVADGFIYWGSWDGLEHATTLTGEQVWERNLGMTTDNDYACDPNSVGIASTATIAPANFKGVQKLVDYVGGGDGNFYALDASNGKTIWQTFLGQTPQHFIWSSPSVYKGSVYIGLSSFGDCPSIQGELVQLNMQTGLIQNIFYVVPAGCLGGSVWGSTTIDPATDSIYFATGNADACWTKEVYAISLIRLHTADLSYIDSWAVPQSDMVSDGDFGSTPTLFTAPVHGTSGHLVGLINKNGIFYALDRDALSKGPVWTNQVSYAGICPVCDGPGTIAPAAWDGIRLFVAGGATTINGKDCLGSLRALNPLTGNALWERCLQGDRAMAPVTVVPGVVSVSEGASTLLLNTANGKTLFSFTDPHSGLYSYSAATICHGRMYIGNFNGYLYSFVYYQPPPPSFH